MAQALRVGVIGTGFGSWCVAPAWEATEGCEVVGPVSPRDDAAVAELCARDDLDVISIHSPPFLHLDHVRRAAEAGHAILCDKPFGLNAEEAEQMCKLADEAGILTFLNFERRFDPGRLRVRQLIADGAIGRPDHYLWSRQIKPYHPRVFGWLCQSQFGGGWMPAQGSHLIDYTRWMFGEIADGHYIPRITVPELADRDGKLQRCDAEDGFVVTLRTEGGVSAVIDSTMVAPVDVPEHLAVLGTEGVIECTDEGVTVRTPEGVQEHAVDYGPKGGLFTSMQNFTEVIRDAVRGGQAHPDTPTFADGLACARVMDQIGR